MLCILSVSDKFFYDDFGFWVFYLNDGLDFVDREFLKPRIKKQFTTTKLQAALSALMRLEHQSCSLYQKN